MRTKIFMSIFLGSVIGGFVAMQMYQALWWIGMMVGGFTGYVSYEFKAVIAAIPRALHAASGWRPDYPAWRSKFQLGFAAVGMAQTILLLITILLLVLSLMQAPLVPEFWLTKEFWKVVLSFQAFMFFVGVLPSARDRQGNLIADPTFSYWKTNPVTVIFWILPVGISVGIMWMILGLPQALAFCLRALGFLKQFSILLFREIHSDARLLCACDAAIGSAIGYFTGNAIIGGITGGLLGVLNYELVSKRLLGLSPQ